MNNTPHYQLEPYEGSNTRYRCPSCGKPKQFTRYIDAETREYIDPTVGICNRIDKCSYHYTPKQYFFDHPHLKNTPQHFVASHSNKALKNTNNVLWYKTNAALLPSKQQQNTYYTPSILANTKPFDTVPTEVYAKSLRYYHHNNFTVGLEKLFGTVIAIELIKQFNIGTAKQPQNGTIFWQVDNNGKVRTGKIMLYDTDTLKRTKNKAFTNNQQGVATLQKQSVGKLQHGVFIPVVDWVHSRLQKSGDIRAFSLQQCLFGLYQLNTAAKDAIIGIVESEKTAVISSMYMPTMVWMATGGAQHLNFSLLLPLMGRRVVLFPDVNQYELWQRKVEYIQQQAQQDYQQRIDIVVSDFLEQNATLEMKANGADLADILIKMDAFTGLALTDFSYPMMWDI